jgi:hypothetical protein
VRTASAVLLVALVGATLTLGCLVDFNGGPLGQTDGAVTARPTGDAPPTDDTDTPPLITDDEDDDSDDTPSDDDGDDPPMDGGDDNAPDDDADPPDSEPPPVESGPPPAPIEAGCSLGTEACDGGCVPAGMCSPPPPPCEETCAFDNAVSECIGEVCTFVECNDGFVDCDGDEANGCEMDFGIAVSPDEPLQVPRVAIQTEDDWLGMPVFPMLATCSPTPDDCGQQDSAIPDQVALFVNASPTAADLRASFSMAWESSGLWIRVVLFDDEWIENIIPSDGSSSEPNPRVYDHVEFVFDGENPRDFGAPQDHHLFMGIDGRGFDQREPASTFGDRVDIDVVEAGICRIVTAKLSDTYLGNGQGQFVAAMREFGFSISVNDFDRNDEDPAQVQRHHQVFYKHPGANYTYGPRQLPAMVLLP